MRTVLAQIAAEPLNLRPEDVLVEIGDTGSGVPDDARSRIFEPFVQAEASTTRQFGGTGLGLAISKRLAEMMGGAVSVQSEPGRGSVFRVELGVARVPAIAEADDMLGRAPGEFLWSDDAYRFGDKLREDFRRVTNGETPPEQVCPR